MEELTAEKFYREDKKWLFDDQKEMWCKNEIIGLMEDYHQAKLKLLGIPDVAQSLALVEVDKDVLKICVDAYKDGEKIQAIKTLIEEVRMVHHFGIKEAKEYLESQC